MAPYARGQGVVHLKGSTFGQALAAPTGARAPRQIAYAGAEHASARHIRILDNIRRSGVELEHMQDLGMGDMVKLLVARVSSSGKEISPASIWHGSG